MKIIPYFHNISSISCIGHYVLAKVILSVFFSFDLTYVQLDYFQVARVFFVFSSFTKKLFPDISL